MDSKHYITFCTKPKKGQHLTLEERGAIKALHKQGLSVRRLPETLAALRPPSHMNSNEAHQSERVVKAELPDTLRNSAKLSTEPIEEVTGNLLRQLPVRCSFTGWSNSSENINELWMPATDMPVGIICFLMMRWSAPAHSTT